MQGRLSYKLKNKGLLIGAPLLILVFYFVVFKKTYEAVTLNYQLKRQVSDNNSLSYNPKYSQDKLRRINTLLDQYMMDTLAWREDFWIHVSYMASARSVGVIFEQKNRLLLPEQESLSTSEMEVQFVGKYRNLIQLIDTLEKSNKLGNLSAIEMNLTKDILEENEKKIIVKANFKVINK